MEEDTEVLDWGQEDDDQLTENRRLQAGHAPVYYQRNSCADDDGEDAVSLGGDDDDVQVFEEVSYPSVQQNNHGTDSITPKPSPSAQHSDAPTGARRQSHSTPRTDSDISVKRSQNTPRSFLQRSRAIPGLPPKPVPVDFPILHHAHQSLTEATAMVNRRLDREQKANSTAAVSSSMAENKTEALPPNWETRYPRNGTGVYYYNTQTYVSTWTHPGAASPSKEPPVIRRKSPEITVSITVESVSSHSFGQPDSNALLPASSLTYEDRHYRPAESQNNSASGAKHEGRFSNHTQRSESPPVPLRPSVEYSKKTPHDIRQNNSHLKSSERRWTTASEAADLSRLRSVPENRVYKDDNEIIRVSSTFESRPSTDDRPSVQRHRSPLLERKDAWAPPDERTLPIDDAPQNNRLDYLADPVRVESRSRAHDIYIPDGIASGEHGPGLTAKVDDRSRTHQEDRESDSAMYRRPTSREPTQHVAMSENLPPTLQDDHSHVRRHSLPPQVARFREIASVPNSAGSPVSSYGSHRRRSSRSRSSNRDDSNMSRGHLGLNSAFGASRNDRWPPDEPEASHNHLPRSTLEIDNLVPERILRSDDNSVRAVSGMYLDGEKLVGLAELPRGPKAMAKQQVFAPPVVAPQLNAAPPNRGLDTLDRPSVQPRIRGGTRWDQRRETSVAAAANNQSRDVARFTEGESDRRVSPVFETNPINREPPRQPQSHRQVDPPRRAPPAIRLTGTNNIPIGTRQWGASNVVQALAPTFPPGSGTEDGERKAPDHRRNGSHEIPARDISPEATSCSVSHNTPVMQRQNSVTTGSVQPFERERVEPTAFSQRPTESHRRREVYYNGETTSPRFERRSSDRPKESEGQRVWIPRESVPSSSQDSYAYNRPSSPPPSGSSAPSPVYDSYRLMEGERRRSIENPVDPHRQQRDSYIEDAKHYRPSYHPPPLESRIGSAYESRLSGGPQQSSHPSLPMNPTLFSESYPGNGSARQEIQPRGRSRSFNGDRDRAWSPDRPRHGGGLSQSQSLTHVYPSHEHSGRNRDGRRRSVEPPTYGGPWSASYPSSNETPKRLLDRLSESGYQSAENDAVSQSKSSSSLRERVQIPSKRGADDMIHGGGDRQGGFGEYEDGEIGRRNKRRSEIGGARIGRRRDGGT